MNSHTFRSMSRWTAIHQQSFHRMYCTFTGGTFRGLTGGQIVYQSLKKHQVDSVFLYSGGAVMPIVDAFYKGDIKYYMNTHEQSGGHAATGYAKLSGKTGVSIVTSGPALTNCVTAITDAMSDSTPLIVISGQVPLASMGTNAFQECPSVDITTPITKWSHCVKDVHDIPWVMDKAFHVAHDGKPGAVHIDMPKCVSSATYTGDTIPEMNHRMDTVLDAPSKERRKKTLTSTEVEHIRTLIESSERPVILAGKGCNSAWKELRAFVEKTKIPITTTIHAMGVVDESTPESLQFLGMHGYPAANHAIQNADLIITLGSRFDDRITGAIHGFAPHARSKDAPGIVHVNIAEEEFNFVLPTPHNYAMDCGDFLSSLAKVQDDIQMPDMTNWKKRIQEWEFSLPFMYEVFPSEISTQEVVYALNMYLNKPSSPKYVVTTGVGNHQMMAAQFITWKHPKTFITSGSLGVMGTGLPYAMGCQIAKPDHMILNIDGDGSFHHTLAELKTIADYNLPVKIAIMNDGHMSMVKTWESLFYNERHTATSLGKNPDYSKLAGAFGIRGMRCDSRKNLHRTIQDFLSYKGPVLCDFRVASDMCLPLVAPGSTLDNMILNKKENSGSYPNAPPS